MVPVGRRKMPKKVNTEFDVESAPGMIMFRVRMYDMGDDDHANTLTVPMELDSALRLASNLIAAVKLSRTDTEWVM